MKLVIMLFMFFILGSLLIVSNNNIFLSNSKNFDKFGELWADWINRVFLNFKEIIREVVSVDLGP